MFDNDHPLMSTASLTALILHAADAGPITLDSCAGRLDALFARAGKTPGLSDEDRRARLARQLEHLQIARILEPAAQDALQLTERGRQALQDYPDGLDQTVLVKYDEFADYLQRTAHHPAGMDPRIGAYDAGYSARLDGLAFDTNPYSENTVDHQSWENGWMQAQEKDSRARPLRPPSER